MAGETPYSERSGCPIATTLDLLGDKWSLVIIRDMMTGRRRFGEFERSPEGITTNILADRLKRLERVGIVERRPYQNNPTRYEYILTEMGNGLLPILQEISRWGNRFIPGTWVPPESFMNRKPEELSLPRSG